MNNINSKDFNLEKFIKSLSEGKCAGCVFNNLCTCNLLPIFQIEYDMPFTSEVVMDDNFFCEYKLLSKDLSDFLVWDYKYFIENGISDGSCSLSILGEQIDLYKEHNNEK